MAWWWTSHIQLVATIIGEKLREDITGRQEGEVGGVEEEVIGQRSKVAWGNVIGDGDGSESIFGCLLTKRSVYSLLHSHVHLKQANF